jgi:hypothetical protein
MIGRHGFGAPETGDEGGRLEVTSLDAEHSITINDPRARVPPILTASCTCGWKGPPRTGRNGLALARQDGHEHLERANKSVRIESA